MARYLLTHRLRQPADLLSFAEQGYRYCAECSTPARPVFRRAESAR